MSIAETGSADSQCRKTCNKGRLIGQKRSLKPRDVWAIQVRLEIRGNKRDIALFNLALDSKLRACDLVRLRVDGVQTEGRLHERATITQKKTGRPVQFELSEQTRRAIREYLKSSEGDSRQYLFANGSKSGRTFRPDSTLVWSIDGCIRHAWKARLTAHIPCDAPSSLKSIGRPTITEPCKCC